MAQVFISYSRKDLTFIEQLVSDLKGAGLDVWYDLTGLDGGTRWRIEIENAIRASQHVVIVLSPDSAVSTWVEREYLFADNLRKNIVPVLYRSCDLPLYLLNIHHIDVRDSNYRQNLNVLLRVLGVPAAKPSASSKKETQASSTSKDGPKASPRARTPRLLILFVALIGLIGLIGISQLVSSYFSKAASQTPVSTLTITEMPSDLPATSVPQTKEVFTPTPGLPDAVTATPLPIENAWSEIVSARMPTLNEIREDLLSIWDANGLSLGDMTSPGVRSFSGTANANQEYLWPVYWCAKDRPTLDENVANISTVFTVNGEAVPDEYIFDYYYDSNTGWKCNYRATVIGGFPKSTSITLLVTRDFKTDIFDGQTIYPAGSYTYELVLSVK